MRPQIPVSLEILKKDTSTAVARLKTLRRGNKKKAEYVVLGSAGISAVTTICIGVTSLANSWAPIYQSAALILSASLTVLTAWDGLYNHKRLWLMQASIVNSLRQIETDIKHVEASGELDSEVLAELYTRYRHAFEEYNTQWSEMRMDDEPANGTSPPETTA